MRVEPETPAEQMLMDRVLNTATDYVLAVLLEGHDGNGLVMPFLDPDTREVLEAIRIAAADLHGEAGWLERSTAWVNLMIEANIVMPAHRAGLADIEILETFVEACQAVATAPGLEQVPYHPPPWPEGWTGWSVDHPIANPLLDDGP